MKGQKFIPWLVVGVGLLAYSNSFRGGFIFDDLPHIVENSHIRQLWPPWEILIHSSRPVVMVSLAVNYALGGLQPWGYHAFNLGVHILAALTLYGVARLTLVSEPLRAQWGEAASWLAGVMALIWLAHPLQTESVTYIIQRCESLAGLFYLLTLYCVIRSSGSSWSRGWQAGAVASCALGMASKEILITAPVVVLLYDRVFLATSWRQVMHKRWRLYGGLASTWLLLPVLLKQAPADWKETAGFGYQVITPLQYALTQPGVILHYLSLAFWPRALCLDYGWQYGWPVVRTAGDAVSALAIVGALLAGTVWAWWRKPVLGFLGVWFFLILAPTSSVMPIADLAFEHRLYLSLAAVVALMTLGGVSLGQHLLATRPRTRKILGWGASGTLVLLLAILTIQRNRDYRSALTIWQDTALKCPNNPRAHNNLGFALLQTDQVPEAIGHLEQALRIRPDYTDAYYNLGIALRRTGRVTDEIAQYEQALRIKPDFAEAHYNLGAALLQTGKVPEAIKHLEQALRIKPDFAGPHNNLGVALFQTGRMQDAVGHLEQALRIEPDYADAHYNLGVVLLQTGKVPEAIRHLEQALRIKPDFAGAHNKLGAALIVVGRPHEALQHFDQALRIKPDLVDAQNDCAWLLATVAPTEGGDPVRAVALAQRACELTGNRVPNYIDTLAVAYAAAGRFNEAVAAAQKGIDLARAAGQARLAGDMEARLELYRRGQAYK